MGNPGYGKSNNTKHTETLFFVCLCACDYSNKKSEIIQWVFDLYEYLLLFSLYFIFSVQEAKHS